MATLHGARPLRPAQAITLPQEINRFSGTSHVVASRPSDVGTSGFFVIRATTANIIRVKPGNHGELSGGGTVSDGTANISIVQADGWMVFAAMAEITIDGDAAGSVAEYFWAPAA